MSSLETAPELNPVEIISKPLQKLEVKPAAQSLAFSGMEQNIIRPTHGLNVQQLNFQNWSLKDRVVSFNEWPLAGSADIWNFEITWSNFQQVFNSSVINFRFFDVEEIVFSIKTNTNAFYAGKIWLVYEPTPSKTFLSDVYNIPRTNAIASQLHRIEISPNSDGEFNFTVPFIYPFEFFSMIDPNVVDKLETLQKNFTDYLQSYPMGRIYAIQVSPLVTNTGTPVNLSYPMSLSVSGLKVGGTYWNFQIVDKKLTFK